MNAAVSKTVVRNFRTGGSNPPLSADKSRCDLKTKTLLVVGLILFAFCTLQAQTKKENWTLITQKAGSKISIDLTGMDASNGEDITIWALEEHGSPVVIESVPKKIYKTKTHYLINKILKRYGIIQLLYYDEKGNVLKHFSYINDSEEASYKYSYPIIPESNMELILARCLESLQK